MIIDADRINVIVTYCSYLMTDTSIEDTYKYYDKIYVYAIFNYNKMSNCIQSYLVFGN